MRTLREWLADVKAGIGFFHIGEDAGPYVQPTSYCGAEEGAQLVWWFTPLCRKCKRISDLSHGTPHTH